MSQTRHIQKRMSQRGIQKKLLNVVTSFGVSSDRDKIILNKKNTEAVLKQLDSLRQKLLDIHKKGGLVVVEVDNDLITTYHLNSYQRP